MDFLSVAIWICVFAFAIFAASQLQRLFARTKSLDNTARTRTIQNPNSTAVVVIEHPNQSEVYTLPTRYMRSISADDLPKYDDIVKVTELPDFDAAIKEEQLEISTSIKHSMNEA